jgi:hypothetical protein
MKTLHNFRWTDDMVRDYFDAHLNTTLHELGAYSGRTRADLKRILMAPQKPSEVAS